MARKKRSAAHGRAEIQEGNDAAKSEAAAATSDAPAVAEKPTVDKEAADKPVDGGSATPPIEPIAPVEEGDAGRDDAPRLDPKDLDVQPITSSTIMAKKTCALSKTT